MATLLIAALAGAASVSFSHADPLACRLESISPGITRIWYEPAGQPFRRLPSLAVPDLPPTRRVSTALVGGEDFSTLLHVERRPDGSWTLTMGLAPEEHLYGLGQDNKNNGRLDRRGTIRDLWAGQQIESGNVTAQYPIPLLLSSGRGGHAYGLFFDNTHRLKFDLGATQRDRLEVDADGGEIDLYVLDGPRLADVIGHYTALTGRPSLPPLWALGYWQSKCTFWDWDQLDRAYRTLMADGFPVDVMVIDADWPEVVTDYRWAARWIASGHGLTPAQKIAEYAREGVRIVMSQSGPMVNPASPTFATGWAQGIFATDGQGHPVECGYYHGDLLDFTNPQLNNWLWPQTRKLDEAGIGGWWLDLDEPEGEPPQTRYYAGTPAEIHNQFALLCALSFEGVQLAVHPNQRPFLLSRAASAGMQRHHAAVWSGDIYSDYATLRAHPPEMLNTGLSGMPYWTCDTGGFLEGYYKNDRYGAHARLYARWMEFSAFSPITRAHKVVDPFPYDFGPQTEAIARHYLKLRYQLMPYIYSYAAEASRDGLPIVRALPLEYPSDPGALAARGDEYLFGRDLLVAPVVTEDQTRRTVYFPPGRWFDWDYGYEYQGGRTWTVAAPLTRIPVAVRAGAIIPLAPEMRHTGEKPWDPLTVEIYPEGHSEFTLYRDDGISFAYENGALTQTRLASDAGASGVGFTIAASNGAFATHEYRLHFHLRRTPAAVTVDGAPVPTDWNPVARILTVWAGPNGGLDHRVAVTLTGGELPPRPAPAL
ncbi:MAG TPA: TIM-barrel domain-containing protein [Opitutaceae bacterium]|nr:TIM-barrel domain-containing protein [Opitutaceae bacterium]